MDIWSYAPRSACQSVTTEGTHSRVQFYFKDKLDQNTPPPWGRRDTLKHAPTLEAGRGLNRDGQELSCTYQHIGISLSNEGMGLVLGDDGLYQRDAIADSLGRGEEWS